jgi:RimJ/RimL family protein N-acetyltransferase
MAFPDSFSTARLTTERLREHHFGDILRMHADARQMETLGGVKDAEETREYLDWNLNQWDRYRHGLWILREWRDGPVVGRALLRHLNLEGRDEVEVGYSFHPDYWGRGLATEIASTLVALGFEQLGLTAVVALTLPTNEASKRVLMKAGLEPAGGAVHAGSTHSLFRTRRLSPIAHSP